MKILIVGAGRAGTSFAAALSGVHSVSLVHHDDVLAPAECDLVMLCVPDDAISEVAATLEVSDHTVVAHVAGSRTLDVLAGHARVASLHPLATLPNALVGAARLRGATFAVDGDELAAEVVTSLEGRIIRVPASSRTIYHATAVASANHLVALMGQVQVLAHQVGLSLEDFWPLARQSLDDVAAYGPAEALTGPASRGDLATLNAHLEVVPLDERTTYQALAQRAQRLAQEKAIGRDASGGLEPATEAGVPGRDESDGGARCSA